MDKPQATEQHRWVAPVATGLQAPAQPPFGECSLGAGVAGGIEITLAGVWVQAGGPAGGQLITRIPL